MKIIMIVYFLKLLVAVTSTWITDLNCFYNLLIYLFSFYSTWFLYGCGSLPVAQKDAQRLAMFVQVKHLDLEGVKWQDA